MNIKDLLHKRVLVDAKQREYSSEITAIELKILEISPCGEWVKVFDFIKEDYWISLLDILPIEILNDNELKDDHQENNVEVYKLLHKRVLIIQYIDFIAGPSVIDWNVEEISPSGNWVKISSKNSVKWITSEWALKGQILGVSEKEQPKGQ